MKYKLNYFILLLLISFHWVSCNNKKSPAPNVILIMTDDQGYGDLSCHGNPILKTPNLDKLSDQSLNFTNFHVSPFCAPTRASIMTGRLAARGRVWSTVNNGNNLSWAEVTMAEFFKSSGYNTGQFGKWHIGHAYPYRPIDRGFDEWFGLGDAGNGCANDYWGNDRVNDHYMHNGKWEYAPGYCNDVFFDKTMEFIEKKKNEPFFVYLATNAPHGSFSLPKEWENEYKGKVSGTKAWGSTADFFATISRIDQNIGRLRKFLSDKGLADNTILIFTTDNGTSGADSHLVFNAGMRGKKGSRYEGGHRVPCFMHWPAGGLNKKATFDKLTSCVDLLPTLKDLCNLSAPKRKLNNLDGISFAEHISNPKAVWPGRTLFFHVQNGTPEPQKWRNSVVLDKQWRLIDGKELYNIKDDFPQKHDIAQNHPEIVGMLTEKYNKYWESLNTKSFKESPSRYIIGSDKQKTMVLTGADGIHEEGSGRLSSYDEGHVRQGNRYNIYWPLEVETDGDYTIEVRRWPREVNKAMVAGIPVQEVADAQLNHKEWYQPEGKAIDIKEVIVDLGGKVLSKPVQKEEAAVSFSVFLKKGNLDLKVHFADDKGKFSAYYVYIETSMIKTFDTNDKY